MPSRTQPRLIASLWAVVALLAACGEPGTGTPPPAAPSSASVPPTPNATASPTGASSAGGGELVVVVDDERGPTVRWHLRCDPPGGDHPDPAAACGALARNGDRALPPVAPHTMCSQIYAGPEKASVTGRWQGRTVRATFSRTNACETARWTALVPLLPQAGGR